MVDVLPIEVLELVAASCDGKDVPGLRLACKTLRDCSDAVIKHVRVRAIDDIRYVGRLLGSLRSLDHLNLREITWPQGEEDAWHDCLLPNLRRRLQQLIVKPDGLDLTALGDCVSLTHLDLQVFRF